MRKLKTIFITFLIIVSIGLILFIISLHLKALQYKKDMVDYTKHSTPLAAEVVADICTKLNISTQDNRCQQEAIVYAPEFAEDIKRYFRDLPEESATKGEVDRVLGPYLLECGPIVRESSGKEYFSCMYDLRGDWYARIAIFFKKGGEIDYIMTSSGGS